MKTVLAAILLVLAAAPADAGDLVADGKALVELNCARCHATGTEGESPHTQAPPFRRLGQRFPLDAMEEAFSTGHITSAHPDMPDFVASPDQVEAILTYLDTIQE